MRVLFEDAENMNGCVSDVDTDMLYTGAAIRRAEDGECLYNYEQRL
ncbi:MAG: hypothetical protein ACLTDF_01540 [Coprococcus sp.]